MACRTGWPDRMIPLGQWLSDERTRTPVDPEADDLTLTVSEIASSETARVTEAYERGRTEAFAEARAAWEMKLAAALHEAERLAQERLQGWAQGVATDLGSRLDAAFSALRQAIEISICEVLEPFLARQVIARSVVALTALIDEDMERRSEALLEIKVPEFLVEPVARAFEGRCSTITITAGSHIDVSFSHQTARFEILTESWLKSLEESRHGG